jgi:glutamine phosphoribosylpyrophosphate amidotransferase
MCGIFGYQFLGNDRCSDTSLYRKFVEELLLQSKIRGLHATGVAFTENGKFVVCKAPLPADKFITQGEWERFVACMPLQAIFHTRYSTSGVSTENRNNHPLALSRAALVHNGLVFMGTKDEFERSYAVRTTTANDSEIILRFISSVRLKFPRVL